MKSWAKRALSAAAVAGLVVIGLPTVAGAHHLVIVAEADCEGPVIRYAAPAWQTPRTSRCTGFCDRHEILVLADEIQSGLGLIGKTFACDDETVVPDHHTLGKALGGGTVPLSAVFGKWDLATSNPAPTAAPSAATPWPAP